MRSMANTTYISYVRKLKCVFYKFTLISGVDTKKLFGIMHCREFLPHEV